jgi:hypothetical protein
MLAAVHVQTHVLSGWCAANLVPRFTPRERLLCMMAASLADLDGLSIVFGREAYWDTHHVLGHNLAYGLVLCALLAAFTTRGLRRRGFVAYLALYHRHLSMDYYGSGPGWGIPYWWPLSGHPWTRADAWAFYSWQNLSAAGAMVACAVAIVYWRGRTPLEAVMPRLDRELVRVMGARRRGRSASSDAVTVDSDG